MAKMALNGYEIGIQRKIKPADHIQSMANKIQDTVVTKHPLNSDTVPSENNSRENTLRRPLNKNFDDLCKTPDNNLNNAKNIATSVLSVDINDVYPPVPPPIPTTPIPTFDMPSTYVSITPTPQSQKKQTDYPLKNSDSNLLTLSILQSLNNTEKSPNGSGYSSNEDMNKDKSEVNISNGNTLRKKSNFEKSSFLDGINAHNLDIYKSELKTDNNFSNTLNKRKIFEKHDDLNSSDEAIKNGNKSNDSWSELNQSNILRKSSISPDGGKTNMNNDEENGKRLPSNLYDNTLYAFKSPRAMKIASSENDTNDIHNNVSELKSDNTETETVVRRREKKKCVNDDGRRDSHIITRPLSTMTSVDVEEGQYPVCHICNKAITR